MLDNQKDSIKTYFDGVADDYDRACHLSDRQDSARTYIFSMRKKYVLDMANIKNARVLDIGCGPGVFTKELLKNGCEVWGIDVSEAMIGLAQKRAKEEGYYKNFHFSVGDIENLNFPDKNFDFVFCVGVLEYLKDDSAAIRQMNRVLKDNGRIIITVPNITSPFVLVDKAVLTAVNIFLKILNGVLNLVNIKIRIPFERLSFRNDIVDKYYFPSVLNRNLEAAGFKIDRVMFHAFRSVTLNSISPRLGLFFMKKLEFLKDSFLKRAGIDYIVKASKLKHE